MKDYVDEKVTVDDGDLDGLDGGIEVLGRIEQVLLTAITLLSASRRFTRFERMKPAPPVTRTR